MNMNINSTELGLIAERIIHDKENRYMNIHKDGKITWDKFINKEAVRVNYIEYIKVQGKIFKKSWKNKKLSLTDGVICSLKLIKVAFNKQYGRGSK